MPIELCKCKAGMSVKNKMIAVLIKIIVCGILAGAIVNVIKHEILMNI